MSTTAQRRVLLAAPRGYCAGVDRAVIAVEKALEQYGAPIYVRKQIVHNKYVVQTLERKGAIFVDETEEVSDGSIVVFSAHGVAPSVHDEAEAHEGLVALLEAGEIDGPGGASAFLRKHIDDAEIEIIEALGLE